MRAKPHGRASEEIAQLSPTTRFRAREIRYGARTVGGDDGSAASTRRRPSPDAGVSFRNAQTDDDRTYPVETFSRRSASGRLRRPSSPGVDDAAAQGPAAVGPGEVPITLTINGQRHQLQVEPRVTLLDAMRTRLDITGQKRVCDRGACGACTVIIDGRTYYSCSMLAIEAQGTNIRTVDGLAKGNALHPVQQAFCDHDGLMCGFCTPGFVMATVALLEKTPESHAGAGEESARRQSLPMRNEHRRAEGGARREGGDAWITRLTGPGARIPIRFRKCRRQPRPPQHPTISVAREVAAARHAHLAHRRAAEGHRPREVFVRHHAARHDLRPHPAIAARARAAEEHRRDARPRRRRA